MKNKTTMLNQKKKSKTTFLHYAVGSGIEKEESDSVIRKSLGRNKLKPKSSKVVK